MTNMDKRILRQIAAGTYRDRLPVTKAQYGASLVRLALSFLVEYGYVTRELTITAKGSEFLASL